MSIPNRQIGWSQESNLLWQVAKQLEKLTCTTCSIMGTSGTSGTSGYDGDRFRTTSTTEFTLGVSTTIVVEPGLAYTPAQDIIITYNVGNHQICTVVSYDINTGVMVIGPPVTVTGSGTYSLWTVNLDGAAGGDGSSGTSGTSGLTGSSGTSGLTGSSGSSGTSGVAGTSGTSGSTGTSGTSGSSGLTGTSGANGTSGTSGSSGNSINLYYGAFIFNSATTLTAGINSNSTAPIPVASTTGFYAPGYIRIGAEIIGYTGISGNTFTGITRGVASSGGSNHSIGAGVAQAQFTTAGVPAQVKLDEIDLSNGVTLNVLTGDVTLDEAKKLSKKYFEPIRFKIIIAPAKIVQIGRAQSFFEPTWLKQLLPREDCSSWPGPKLVF
jgi:hypothetical protein